MDAVAFTGGVGENSARIRTRVLEGLKYLGAEVDPDRNHSLSGGRAGAFHSGWVFLGVVARGEELAIALETARVATGKRGGDLGGREAPSH